MVDATCSSGALASAELPCKAGDGTYSPSARHGGNQGSSQEMTPQVVHLFAHRSKGQGHLLGVIPGLGTCDSVRLESAAFLLTIFTQIVPNMTITSALNFPGHSICSPPRHSQCIFLQLEKGGI